MAWIRPPICSKCGGPSTRKQPCKPCRNAYLRKWNREHGITTGEGSGGRPRIFDQFTNQPLTATQRYKLRYPERNKAQRAAYKQKPEVKIRERLRANLSRARIGGYGHGELEVSEFDLQRMIDGQHGMCAMCARTDRPLTLDHIVPVSKGGTNALGNLQLLCRQCNTSKMTKAFSGIGYLLALRGLTLAEPPCISQRRSRRPSRKRHVAEPTN